MDRLPTIQEFAATVTVNEARNIIEDYKDFTLTGVVHDNSHLDRAMAQVGIPRHLYGVSAPVLLAEFAWRFI